jgi:hypothetical protein
MIIAIDLTLKGGIIMFVGFVSFLMGFKDVMKPFGRIHAIGLILFGIGAIAAGATNGFADWSPLGRRLFQVGMPSLVLGLGMLVYWYARTL